MVPQSNESELSPFTVAVYAFLRGNIDTLDVGKITGADFSTLLDLKKAVDAVATQGMERWRNGEMP